MAEDFKSFILEFFKNAEVSDKNGVLTVDKVASDFEDFIGEKAPYTLVFDFDKHNKTEGSELIVKGSYFLAAIRDYMRTKAQTSLMKLKFKEEDLKKIKVPGFEVSSVEVKEMKFFVELNFMTSCQYLNDKKEFLHKFVVKDGELLDLDIMKLELEKGNSEEIVGFDIQKQYEFAQKKLNEVIKKETKDIKKFLKDKLEVELTRVRDHYGSQISEKDEELERAKEKIKLLESQLRHTYYERDQRILQMKVREAKERLEELKKVEYAERLRAEEMFHITDEVEKHALSVENHLVHACVVYYPVYNFNLVKNKKQVKKSYDVFLKKFE